MLKKHWKKKKKWHKLLKKCNNYQVPNYENAKKWQVSNFKVTSSNTTRIHNVPNKTNFHNGKLVTTNKVTLNNTT